MGNAVRNFVAKPSVRIPVAAVILLLILNFYPPKTSRCTNFQPSAALSWQILNSNYDDQARTAGTPDDYCSNENSACYCVGKSFNAGEEGRRQRCASSNVDNVEKCRDWTSQQKCLNADGAGVGNFYGRHAVKEIVSISGSITNVVSSGGDSTNSGFSQSKTSFAHKEEVPSPFTADNNKLICPSFAVSILYWKNCGLETSPGGRASSTSIAVKCAQLIHQPRIQQRRLLVIRRNYCLEHTKSLLHYSLSVLYPSSYRCCACQSDHLCCWLLAYDFYLLLNLLLLLTFCTAPTIMFKVVKSFNRKAERRHEVTGDVAAAYQGATYDQRIEPLADQNARMALMARHQIDQYGYPVVGAGGFSENSSFEAHEHYERKVQRVKKSRADRDRAAGRVIVEKKTKSNVSAFEADIFAFCKLI